MLQHTFDRVGASNLFRAVSVYGTSVMAKIWVCANCNEVRATWSLAAGISAWMTLNPGIHDDCGEPAVFIGDKR